MWFIFQRRRSSHRCLNRKFWKVQKTLNPHVKPFMEVNGRILSFLLPTNVLSTIDQSMDYFSWLTDSLFSSKLFTITFLMDPECNLNSCTSHNPRWSPITVSTEDVLVVMGSYLFGGQAKRVSHLTCCTVLILFLPASRHFSSLL